MQQFFDEGVLGIAAADALGFGSIVLFINFFTGNTSHDVYKLIDRDQTVGANGRLISDWVRR